MKFCFEEYNVILKSGLVRLLTEWSNSETNSSILYDSKFVQLLVVAIFSDDEIINNNFDKKKFNFMKGDYFSKTMNHTVSSFFLNFECIYFNDCNSIFFRTFKGAFSKRVGQNSYRMMRFVDYIQRSKENAMKKQKKMK